MEPPIKISVGEIVQLLSPQPEFESFNVPMRAALGQRSHERMRSNFPEFDAEVAVVGDYISESGRRLSMRGRIDFVEIKNDLHKIIEYKTILLPATGTGLRDIALPTRFALQAQIYAYLYNKKLINSNETAPTHGCEVRLCNLTDHSERHFKLKWTPEEIEEKLERFVAIFIRLESEANIDQVRRRAIAGKLKWSFDSYRSGQEDIKEAVERTFAEGGDILIAAPTGIGKTTAVLLPSLKYILAEGGQLFFTTAKSGGRNPILKGINSLSYKKLPLVTMVMQSRYELCLRDPRRCNSRECEYYDDEIEDEKSGIEDRLSSCQPGIYESSDFHRMGEQSGICPVLIARQYSRRADVVICDYNFIFSTRARLTQFRDAVQTNSILLMDEGHNLYDRVRDVQSIELRLELFKECRQMLQDEIWLHSDQPYAKDLLDALVASETLFATVLEQFSLEESGMVDFETREWEKLYNKIGLTMSEFMVSTAGRIDRDLFGKLWELFRTLREFITLLNRDREKYLCTGDGAEGSLGLYCLNPADEMREMYRRFKNVAVFSATLSPFDFYREALGFGERPTLHLEVAGWLDKERRVVQVVSDVDTRYKARPNSVAKIARIIERTVSLQRGGYLIVFPSYGYINLIAGKIKLKNADLFIQTPRMVFEERKKINRALSRRGKTTVAFVVAGGQFTEAVDLPGDACVGVIIVSPCLPPRDEWREAIREYWNRRGDDGHAIAYLYHGIRRVVQAGGRLFRHEKDRGIILLIGKRFASEPINGLLPSDWKESISSSGDKWEVSVSDFWERLS